MIREKDSGDEQKTLPPSGILRSPSNGLTRLSLAFVCNVDPSIDINVQLVWNFGAFLREVPRRLGTNEALDAASDALVTAYTWYTSSSVGYRIPDTEALTKHSLALNALRNCLDDPVKAHSSETLCAIMLLQICQVLLGVVVKPWMSHAVGAAQVLKSRGRAGPQDDFERMLLLTLRGSVVIEALANNRIRFTREEWEDLVVSDLDTGMVEGDVMACLSRLPELMQRAREASSQQDLNSLLEVTSELRTLYQAYQPTLGRLRMRCSWVEDAEGSEDPLKAVLMRQAGPGNPLTPKMRRMVHCHYSKMLAFGAAVAICINSVLAALEGGNAQLREESAQLSLEILGLADTVSVYRPLGAASMVLCLTAAWVGTGDFCVRRRIEAALTDYGRDIFGKEAETLTECLGWWQRQLTLS